MQRTRKQPHGELARPGVSWLVLGLVTLSAGCAGGTSPERGSTGTGGHGPTPTKPTPGKQRSTLPSGKAPECSVTSATDLGTAEATSPAVAFADGRFAVAWTEEHTGLHLAVVDDGGNQVGARLLSTGPKPAEAAVTALPAGGFLVVWQEPGSDGGSSAKTSGAVRGLRVGTDASPVGSAFTLGNTAGGKPRPSTAAATGGTAIAWADATGVTLGELGETGLESEVTVPGAADPALAASADALVFIAGNKLGFARLALPLRNVKPQTFSDLPGQIKVPRASAAGDGSFFVTWEDDTAGNEQEAVYLTRIGADGKPASEVLVPGEAGSANYPDVATVGGYAAVVYYQFRDGPSAVYLSLLGPDLRPAAEDLRISEKGARYARVASGAPEEGALGVVYARRQASARLSLVTCH